MPTRRRELNASLDDIVTPCQRLARAVLRQAIEDARGMRTPNALQCRARHFLRDRHLLGFWCAIAGIDRDLVRDALKDV